MRVTPSLLLAALLPLFAGCQMLAGQPEPASTAGQTRMQGILTAEGGQLLFKPCEEVRRFAINDAGGTGVLQEAVSQAAKPGPIFADLRGTLGSATKAGADGTLNVQQLYRIERSATACSDPNFKRLIVGARGHSPEWNLKANNKGMVLERAGVPPLAVPYLEEQLPDGRLSVSTEANGQRVDLWIAPQRCVDSSTGAVSHLTAELRVDGQTLRGCAHYGGARAD